MPLDVKFEFKLTYSNERDLDAEILTSERRHALIGPPLFIYLHVTVQIQNVLAFVGNEIFFLLVQVLFPRHRSLRGVPFRRERPIPSSFRRVVFDPEQDLVGNRQSDERVQF